MSCGNTQPWGRGPSVLRNAPCLIKLLPAGEVCMRLLLSSLLTLIFAAATPLAFDAEQRRGAGAGGAVTFAVVVTDPAGTGVGGVKVIVTGAAERTGRTEAGRLVFENLPAGAGCLPLPQ